MEFLKKYGYYIKGLLVILLFFFSDLFSEIPIILFNIKEITPTISIYLSLFSNIMLAITLIIIYFKDLKKEWLKFKSNAFKNLDIGVKYWLVGLIGMMISNVILGIFVRQQAANEELVQQMLKALPWVMIINTGVLAPIIEEICFRKTFYDALRKKNRWVFILSSGFFFGALHVIFSIRTPLDLLFIIPYSSLGIAFAYMYDKTESVFTSMSMHAMHNTLLSIISVLRLMI